MFQSHSPRSNSWYLYKGLLNMFWPLCLKVAKLDMVDTPIELMFPVDFQVKRSKVNVNLLISIPSIVYWNLMTLCLMVTKLATLVDFWKRIIPIALCHKVKVKLLFFNYLSVVHNVLWNICLIITKLGVMITTGEQIIIIDFQVHMTKVLVNFALSVLID